MHSSRALRPRSNFPTERQVFYSERGPENRLNMPPAIMVLKGTLQLLMTQGESNHEDGWTTQIRQGSSDAEGRSEQKHGAEEGSESVSEDL